MCHIIALAPKKFTENPAILLSSLDWLKLPWLPSCITLKPIAAVNIAINRHSGMANHQAGVKNTKCMYKEIYPMQKKIALDSNRISPVEGFFISEKYWFTLAFISA